MKTKRMNFVLDTVTERMLRGLATRRKETLSQVVAAGVRELRAIELTEKVTGSLLPTLKCDGKPAPVVIAHAPECDTNLPGFVPWCGEGPPPDGYPTCTCDFGARLKAHLESGT